MDYTVSIHFLFNNYIFKIYSIKAEEACPPYPPCLRLCLCSVAREIKIDLLHQNGLSEIFIFYKLLNLKIRKTGVLNHLEIYCSLSTADFNQTNCQNSRKKLFLEKIRRIFLFSL